MHPSKSILDYMYEMNLNPRSNEFPENDMFLSPTPPNMGIFNQTFMAQSSSSAETSPDTFPDLSPHQFPPEICLETRKPNLYVRASHRQEQYHNQYRHEEFEGFRPESAFQTLKIPKVYEGHSRPFEYMNPEMPYGTQIRPDLNIDGTPLIMRRQRPIMGRKIMATTETPLKAINEFSMWQPKSEWNTSTTQIYELFPSENTDFKLPSPVKSSPHDSPFQTSPRVSLSSSATPPRSPFSHQISPFKEPLVGPSSTVNYRSAKMCSFCRKNGETPLVYMTHMVKEKVGNKTVVTCPILRSHVCSTCGASGDKAHTITYCPVLRTSNNGQPLQSTTITLKNTRVKSNGRRRF